MNISIHHNPDCGTSRNTLAMILGDASLSEAQLLGAMMAHSILINRPLVVTPRAL